MTAVCYCVDSQKRCTSLAAEVRPMCRVLRQLVSKAGVDDRILNLRPKNDWPCFGRASARLHKSILLTVLKVSSLRYLAYGRSEHRNANLSAHSTPGQAGSPGHPGSMQHRRQSCGMNPVVCPRHLYMDETKLIRGEIETGAGGDYLRRALTFTRSRYGTRRVHFGVANAISQ
jgi:hypothetical protein